MALNNENYKKRKRQYVFFTLIDYVFAIGPGLVFTILALRNTTAIRNKVCVSIAILLIGIITFIQIINQILYHKEANFKSKFWILFFVLYFCFDAFLIPIFVFAICQILNELIFQPLQRKYKHLYLIQKEAK